MLSALPHVSAPSRPWLSEPPGASQDLLTGVCACSFLSFVIHSSWPAHIFQGLWGPQYFSGAGDRLTAHGVWIGTGMRVLVERGGSPTSCEHGLAGASPSHRAAAWTALGHSGWERTGAQYSRKRDACASLGTAGASSPSTTHSHTQPWPEPSVLLCSSPCLSATALQPSGCCAV